MWKLVVTAIPIYPFVLRWYLLLRQMGVNFAYENGFCVGALPLSENGNKNSSEEWLPVSMDLIPNLVARPI